MYSDYYATYGAKIQELQNRIAKDEFENKMGYPCSFSKNDPKFRAKRELYREENSRLQELFTCEAIRACGLENHKNGRKAFDKAWEDRHSEGYSAVLDTLEDLAELMIG